MNHLLRAARIVPYGGGRAQGPLAVNDTGLNLSSGQTTDFNILFNDQRFGENPQLTLVGAPTGPISSISITANDLLRVTASTGSGAWSQTYRIETAFGFSQAVASGTVQAVVTTASIVGQWELNNGFLTPTVGSIAGSVVNQVQFAQPTIPSGGGGGVAMTNGLGHILIPDPGTTGAPGVFQKQAFGISIYAQVGALAAAGGAATTAFTDGSNWSDGSAWTDSGTSGGGPPLQLVHKDVGQPPGGIAIEYANFGGVNRLDPYMRDASDTVRRFNPPVGTERNLSLNGACLVTFTYEPNPTTGGKCKFYLRKIGGSNVLIGDGLTDESGITQGLLLNFADLVLGTYQGTVGAMTGALQRLVFWSGAPTKPQLDTLLAAPANNITISYPQVAQPPVAGDFTSRNIAATSNSFTLDPTLAPSTNAGSAVVSIVSVVPTGKVTATVSTADNQTVTVARITGQTGTYTVNYRLTVAGLPTDDGVISGTVSAVVTGDVVEIPSGCTYVGKVGITVSLPTKPAYNHVTNQAYIDSTKFPGIRIIRAAGDPNTAVPIVGGNWPVRAKFQYASTPPWNHDEDLMCMNNLALSNGNVLYINGQPPYAPRWARNNGVDPKLLRWRPQHPRIQIYVTGNAIKSYDPYDQIHTTLKTFSGVTNLSFGIYPGSGMNGQISYDGHWMAVTGLRSSSNRIIAKAYNLTTGQEGADIPIYIPPYFLDTSGAGNHQITYAHPTRGIPDHDFITIDASGKYVLHMYQGGNDVHVFDAITGESIANSADPSPFHPMFDKLKHPDATLSGNGLIPYLTFGDRTDPGGDRLARVTLPNLDNLVYFCLGSDANVSHASGNRQWRQRSDGKRWCSTFGVGNSAPTTITQPLYGTVFRYDVDNPNSDGRAIQLLGHHRTTGGSTTTGSESWHAISPSGTRSCFTSTWHGPSINGGQAADQWYIVEHCEFLNS